MSGFELNIEFVRESLERVVSTYPVAKLEEKQSHGFSEFYLSERPGTASLVLVVDGPTQLFEFETGKSAQYEGSYLDYAGTKRFFNELVNLVVTGEITEIEFGLPLFHCNFITKTITEIPFESFPVFRMTSVTSLLSVISVRKKEKNYLAYALDRAGQ